MTSGILQLVLAVLKWLIPDQKRRDRVAKEIIEATIEYNNDVGGSARIRREYERIVSEFDQP